MNNKTKFPSFETVYNHPDGMGISFALHNSKLIAYNEEISVHLSIGPLGLIDLGHRLIALGEKLKPSS